MFFLRNHWAIFNQILYVIEMKIYQHGAGHMLKIAANFCTW